MNVMSRQNLFKTSLPAPNIADVLDVVMKTLTSFVWL